MKVKTQTTKKKLTLLVIGIILIIAICFNGIKIFGRSSNTGRLWYFSGNTEKKIAGLNSIPEDALTDYDSLMVVAHPDDETIWGGDHLLNGKYVVVCITNGNNSKRRAEFASVMKQTGSVGLMLTYPDKTAGKRDNWDSCREQIQKDIDTIVRQKNWSVIATHNLNGEYGHIHHQMTSAITTSSVEKAELTNQLYYFGTYVKAKNMKKSNYQQYLTNPLTGDELEAKLSLTKLYGSQSKVMDHLGHMFPYENWIPASQSASQH